jgi:hypothetical protein
MSEEHPEHHEGYARENQIKRRGTQPGLELFPLLPKKISKQDVTDGIGRRPGEIVKKGSVAEFVGKSMQGTVA